MRTFLAAGARWCGLVAGLVLGVGCASVYKPVLHFHEEVPATLPPTKMQTVDFPKANLRLTVDPHWILSERDVVAADLIRTVAGAAVYLRFDPHGRATLEEVTTRNRGRRLAVLLDGRAVAVWMINQSLRKGEFLLEGDFSDEEAAQLVEGLNRMRREEW
ncbi:hypothetical protein HQ590_05815 [bacterium]|nr:hypothetical protein [bacterium]